ncbi:MAG: SDR family oxidoreductase, partial [Planctomycetota bacterium]
IKKVKFTVLGGRGVIGRALASSLRGQGHEVEVLGRTDQWNFGVDWGHVIYAVGMTADFRTRRFETVDAHVTVLSKVLQQARFVSLLYLSSTRVYMGASSTVETAPLQVDPSIADDVYNLSKLLGEALCLSDPRSSVRVVRLSNVVGGEDAQSENFIPTLLREASGGAIRLRTALTSAKDYIHIDDVVPLLCQIPMGGAQRLYNVASGMLITHAQWVERIRAATGCSLEVAPDAPVLKFPVIDVGRIQAEFGFVPRSPLTALRF